MPESTTASSHTLAPYDSAAYLPGHYRAIRQVSTMRSTPFLSQGAIFEIRTCGAGFVRESERERPEFV